MNKKIKRHQKRELKLQKQREKELRGRRLGLYVHIPFCRQKCDYCDFYSVADRSDRMADYTKALVLNLEEMAPQSSGFTVDTVYIGGGTPSVLGDDHLKKLLKTIDKRYRLEKGCEMTVEVNPDSVTSHLLKTLRKGGVNRISMGVQSSDDHALAELHRPHTFAQAKEAVKMIRDAGFDNLSLDLIYGLPDQSQENWQASLDAVLELQPEHLSLYGLTLEEGTPLWQRKDTLILPDGDAQADMYLWAVERLAQTGYDQYEISNFAREGYRSRHNLKYWTGQEYVGFGPGAHSDFGDRRYSYIRDLDGYIDGMLNGGIIVDKSELIPLDERGYEYLMLRLRTVQGIDGVEYSKTYRRNFEPLLELLYQYEDQGWAVQEKESGRWHFTPSGFLISNQLIGQMLDAQEARTLDHVLPRIHRDMALQ
jgi:oxygen-independent coproporphyrinogen-3 oxidase